MTESEAIKFARDVLNDRPDMRGMLARTGFVKVAIPSDAPATYEGGQDPANDVAPWVEVVLAENGDWIFNAHVKDGQADD